MKYILILMAFIVLALLLIQPAGEADTWMHIKTGEVMVKNMRISSVDDYSYTKAGEKWLNHQWLSQVIFYFIYKLSGINGLIIFTAGLIFFAFILLFLNIYRIHNWLWSVFLMLQVILFSQGQFLARPLAFSLFLFSLFMFILHRYKYLWRSKKENILYALIPLQVLWANLHGASIMGIFLLWAFIIGEFIDTKIRHDFKGEFVIKGERYKKLLFVGGMLVISTGLTPYGYDAVLFSVREFNGMRFINEWLPTVHKDIFLNFGAKFYFRIFLFISIFVFVLKGRFIASSHILIFASLLYLSLSGIRHLPLYGFAIAPCITEYLKHIKFEVVTLRFKNFFIHLVSVILVFYLVLLGKDMLTGKYYADRNIYCWVGLGKIGYPEEAMNFLEKSGLEGNMFNDYGSGCFLIERLYPSKKVFIDGRNTIYGIKFIIENYMACLNDPLLFENLVKKYNINYAFIYYGLGNTAELIPHLFYSPQDWQIVYFDDEVCIFARNNEKNAEIIKRHHFDLTKKKHVARLNKYDWQSVYPWFYINRAALYETLGFVDMAIDTLRDTLVIAPRTRNVHYNLGSLYLKKEMYEDAIKEFKETLRIDKRDADAHNNLGVTYARIGKYKDAIAQFRKTLWIDPLNAFARRNLRMAIIDVNRIN